MNCHLVVATALVLSLVLTLGSQINLEPSGSTGHPEYAREPWRRNSGRRLRSISDETSDQASQLFWKQINQVYGSNAGKQLLAPSSPFIKALRQRQQGNIKLSSEQPAEQLPSQQPIPDTRPKELWATQASGNTNEESAPGVRSGVIPLSYAHHRNRKGYFYLPAGWNEQEMPAMVFMHGTNDTGRDMAWYFSPLADKHKFIFIAPDSSNKFDWLTPAANQKATVDWLHVEACYQWVTAIPGLKLDSSKITYAGFSRGGYSAIAMATRIPRATHGMNFHSAVNSYQLGNRTPPLWISTGRQDVIFPQTRMARVIQAIRGLKNYWGNIKFIAFSGPHGLNNKFELESSIEWWYSN